MIDDGPSSNQGGQMGPNSGYGMNSKQIFLFWARKNFVLSKAYLEQIFTTGHNENMSRNICQLEKLDKSDAYLTEDCRDYSTTAWSVELDRLTPRHEGSSALCSAR